MNLKIKAIAEQSLADLNGTKILDAQVFAELIIKKCVDIFEDVSKDNSTDSRTLTREKIMSEFDLDETLSYKFNK